MHHRILLLQVTTHIIIGSITCMPQGYSYDFTKFYNAPKKIFDYSQKFTEHSNPRVDFQFSFPNPIPNYPRNYLGLDVMSPQTQSAVAYNDKMSNPLQNTRRPQEPLHKDTSKEIKQKIKIADNFNEINTDRNTDNYMYTSHYDKTVAQTMDYTSTEAIDYYESTTPSDDDINNRVGVSEQIAASLIG